MKKIISKLKVSLIFHWGKVYILPSLGVAMSKDFWWHYYDFSFEFVWLKWSIKVDFYFLSYKFWKEYNFWKQSNSWVESELEGII